MEPPTESTRPVRRAYPSDGSDDAWAFVAPHLALMTDDAPQRLPALREVVNGLRWLARTGAQWCRLPHDRPPWPTRRPGGREVGLASRGRRLPHDRPPCPTVYQPMQRWLKADVFEAMVHDVRHGS